MSEREIAYNIKDRADGISIEAVKTVIDVAGSDRNNGKDNDGEVFTPHWCVVDMCNLASDDIEDLGKTVLEPACGNGNIIIEVVRRKLASAYRQYMRENDRDTLIKCMLLAIKTVYAIDISRANVEQCRARVMELIISFWSSIQKENARQSENGMHADILIQIEDILETNIIWGDALENKMWAACDDGRITEGTEMCLQVFNWNTCKYEFLGDTRPNALPTIAEVGAGANEEVDDF